MTADEAIATLRDAGFNWPLVHVDSTKKQDTVATQCTGAGGASAELGLSIQLGISTGVAPEEKVPDVVGLTSVAAPPGPQRRRIRGADRHEGRAQARRRRHRAVAITGLGNAGGRREHRHDRRWANARAGVRAVSRRAGP